MFFRESWCLACIKALKDLESNKTYFTGENIRLIAISTDMLADLKKMSDKLQLSFPVLADENQEFLKQYGVYLHGEESPYEDTGIHGEPAYFLMDENGELLYQQRQTSPYGRPSADELQQIIRFIKKKLQTV
ncbi:peroxiredoxin family protein [Planococcus shenhongbingii]|uniref:peroxiredoxin family protein n=1 Tax=Planococcus shenhongbingii TaxID=3058398 RepID=UPI00345D650F